MKRNMKMMLSALSVMLIMALAVTVLSFSLAGEEDNSVQQKSSFSGATADSNTNIDNIIENSYATYTDADPVYKIVEIGSGTASAGFDVFANGDFEDYVIDGNRTILDAMKDGQISYKYFRASDVTDENTAALAAVSNADFIYVSNDDSNPYAVGNDMGEKLYDILHTYAVGDYKPLIIDKSADVGGSSGGSSGETGTNYSMANLATYEYGLYGKYRYTFAWDLSKSVTAKEFFTRKGSLYLGINGGKRYSKWIEVTDSSVPTPTDGSEKQTAMMSEVLVISNGGTDRYDLVSDGFSAVTTLEDMTGTAISGDVYDITKSPLYENGYNANYLRPTYTRVSIKTLSEATASTEALDKYDMIIIEDSCSSATLDEASYNKLVAAMYANISIVYPSTMASTVVDETVTPDDGRQQTTNYSELFYMVATTDGQVKYENVMIPNKGQMNVIINSDSADTCKVIADLINASAFRGNGGPKSSSSKFTVLEIQPCYPIDETLAGTLGDYYTVPSDVVNSKTKEELTEGTEYYAWELSKAKIAAAYGLSVDQINLVQVSTEELAAMKDDILGNYDLVYIGGNTSALKSVLERRSFAALSGSSGGPMGQYINTVSGNLDKLTQLPIYGMYTHTGDPVLTDFSMLGESGKTVSSGIPTAYVNVDGTYKASFTLSSGNDITYNKLEELKEYVKAGMPVVFSKDATEAYQLTKEKGYNQNSIDPDCNMYKFMKYCGATTTTNVAAYDNVLWNFDNSVVIDSDNNGGDYGDTLTGYVSIFDKQQNNELQTIYANSKKRPKLTLTGAPTTYNLYDTNSYIKGKTLNYSYKVTGAANYSVELYADDNGNSIFEDSEVVATATASEIKDGKLSFKVADSFYGPLYWKLVVKASNGLEASTTGICYITNTGATKQKIRILQIMPGDAGTPGASGAGNKPEGPQGENSLYFCTVCQQAYKRLEYNPSLNTGSRTDFTALYDGQYYDKPDGDACQGNKDLYLGLHEHNFGVVPYESGISGTYNGETFVGADNWDANLADDVSDRYEFDLDIMTRSEFVDASYDISEANDTTNMTAADKEELLAKNPYKEGTTEYASYTDATVEEQLTIVYETERDEALASYNELNSLIKYTEDDYDKAFADYPYKDNLKKEFTSYSDEEKANLTHTRSAIDAEIELRNAIINLRDTIYSVNPNDTNNAEFNRMLEMRNYWDFYVMDYIDNTGKSQGACYFTYTYLNGFSDDAKLIVRPSMEAVDLAYKRWVGLSDEKIVALNKYKEYDRYVNSDKWLFECYDMVIIGPANDFGQDDFYLSRTETTLTTDMVDTMETVTVEERTLYPGTLTFKIKAKLHSGAEGDYSCAEYSGWGIPMNSQSVDIGVHMSTYYAIDSRYYQEKTKYSVANPAECGSIVFNIKLTSEDFDVPDQNSYVSGKTGNVQGIPLDIEIVGSDGTVYHTESVVTDNNGECKVIMPKNYTSKEVKKTIGEVKVDTVYETTTTYEKDANGNKLPATVALADLRNYVSLGGNILMFHDTMGVFKDAGPAYLTEALRDLMGMNRFNMEVDTTVASSVDGVYYVPYVTTSKLGEEVYFMTDLSPSTSTYDDNNIAKYTNWDDDMNKIFMNTTNNQLLSVGGKYLSDVAYTDAGGVMSNTGGTHDGDLVYKYANIQWSHASVWAEDIQTYIANMKTKTFGSDKASKTNEGIVTMYPFTLSDQLNISATHAQAYALDIESDDMTVWYSMAGGTGKKTGSSIYAASPNDGMDSYFIYTYKNVNYCGAGHTDVTGIWKDNNDERRLYINIICNSVRKSVVEPDIFVYDYQTTENKDFVKVGDEYLYKVNDTDEYPEFSLFVRLDESADIAKVTMYYDLDYLTTTATDKDACGQVVYSQVTGGRWIATPANPNHVIITQNWGKDNVPLAKLRDIGRYDADLLFYDDVDEEEETYPSYLKLKPEYFDPYNGQYTYIVIEIEDTLGNVTYKRIKIELRDKLFNLT